MHRFKHISDFLIGSPYKLWGMGPQNRNLVTKYIFFCEMLIYGAHNWVEFDFFHFFHSYYIIPAKLITLSANFGTKSGNGNKFTFFICIYDVKSIVHVYSARPMNRTTHVSFLKKSYRGQLH